MSDAPAPEPKPGGKERRQRHPDAEQVYASLFGADRLDLVQRKETAFDADFNTYMIENIGLGPWGRGVLSLPQLSIATLSLLAAQGRFPQFEAHMRLALNVSMVPPVQLKELLLHLVMYCGMPTGPEIFGVARKVFREAGIDFNTLLPRTATEPPGMAEHGGGQ